MIEKKMPLYLSKKPVGDFKIQPSIPDPRVLISRGQRAKSNFIPI